jgi:phosphoribosylformimino-5-aminoimidazole carboxamide ribotide isomerase
MKIIPAIDLQDGKCVRLYQGDFDKKTVYSDNPADIARQFSELQVSDLHVVDLDGAKLGSQQNRASIEAIIEQTSLTVQLGGGIRERDKVAEWLAVGVSRCVIGSMAVSQPDEVANWFADFGGDAIVLALDVNIGDDATPYLTTHGWTKQSDTSLWVAIDRFLDVGLKHVLCTDVSRDGAMAGPNRLLYDDILDRYPQLALQASGGVRDIEDLVALRESGLPAAITGRAMLDGRITPAEVASFQQNA